MPRGLTGWSLWKWDGEQIRRSPLTVLPSDIWEALPGRSACGLGWFCGVSASAEVVLLFANRDHSSNALLAGRTLLWHHR